MRRCRSWILKPQGLLVALLGTTIVLPAAGCQTFQRETKPSRQTAPPKAKPKSPTVARPPRSSNTGRVQSVICLYDQKPWINADIAGDRDPEGIQYRIFLNAGGDKGVARDGTFHIEMYRIGRDEKGQPTRVLASDWHYPTSEFSTVSANLLGVGYLVQLRWATKDIAGNEVEIVTQFEDESGNTTRGATKRLRVPKYSS